MSCSALRQQQLLSAAYGYRQTGASLGAHERTKLIEAWSLSLYMHPRGSDSLLEAVSIYFGVRGRPHGGSAFCNGFPEL